MSVDTRSETPFQEPESSQLHLLIGQFDLARGNLLYASERLAQRPLSKYADPVQTQGNSIVTIMEDITWAIIANPDESDTQKSLMLGTIIEEDDKLRVAGLSRIFEGVFEESGQDRHMIASGIEELLARDDITQEAFVSHLIGGYQANLQADLFRLQEAVNASSKAKLIRVGKLASKHAFDVLKTGAAVSLGIAVAKRFRK